MPEDSHPLQDKKFSLHMPRPAKATLEMLQKAHKNGSAVNVNAGIWTQADVDRYNKSAEDVESGKDLPVTPAVYQPAVVDAILESGARCSREVRTSNALRRPGPWDDKSYGPWRRGLAVWPTANRSLRAYHHEIEQLVPLERDWISINGRNIVLGVKAINPSRMGLRHTLWAETFKFALSKSKLKGIDNLVGMVNNRLEILPFGTGKEGWVYNPGFFVRWGYMKKGNKTLTHAELRGMADSDGKAKASFVALTSAETKKLHTVFVTKEQSLPLVLKALDRKSLPAKDWDKAWQDFTETGTRISVDALEVYGQNMVSVGIIGSKVWVATPDKKDVERAISFCIGDYSALWTADHMERRTDAKFRLGINKGKESKPKKDDKPKSDKGKKAKKSTSKSGKKTSTKASGKAPTEGKPPLKLVTPTEEVEEAPVEGVEEKDEAPVEAGV